MDRRDFLHDVTAFAGIPAVEGIAAPRTAEYPELSEESAKRFMKAVEYAKEIAPPNPLYIGCSASPDGGCATRLCIEETPHGGNVCAILILEEPTYNEM